jgi:hypothetical protein
MAHVLPSLQLIYASLNLQLRKEKEEEGGHEILRTEQEEERSINSLSFGAKPLMSWWLYRRLQMSSVTS